MGRHLRVSGFPLSFLLFVNKIIPQLCLAWGVHCGNREGENQANPRLSALTALERAKVYPWEVECERWVKMNVKDQTARREFKIWMAQLVNCLSQNVSALTQISSTPVKS